MAKESNPVIICAALTGAATSKQNNPSSGPDRGGDVETEQPQHALYN